MSYVRKVKIVSLTHSLAFIYTHRYTKEKKWTALCSSQQTEQCGMNYSVTFTRLE